MSTIEELASLTGGEHPILRNALLLRTALSSVALTDEDAAARGKLIQTASAALTALGVDAESLIRYGMHVQIGSTLVTLLFLEAAGMHDVQYAIDQAQIPAWRELLKLPMPEELIPGGILTGDDVKRIARDHFSRIQWPVRQWIENGPLADVLSMRAPALGRFEEALSSTEPSEDVRDRYQWASDRLTEVDLTKWPTASLYLEHRWQAQELPQVFVEPMFTARTVPNDQLTAEIARRAVSGADSNENFAMFHQLQSQAKAFLIQGKHAEASALFAFYTTFHDDDAYAHNNYGFCLIPVDPATAMDSLERAKSRGYPQLGILAYNRACCLMLLSREGEALDVLEYYWQRQREQDAVACTLWRRSGASFEVYEEMDIRSAVARLGAELSERVAPERYSKWSERSKKPGQDVRPAA